MFTIELSTVYLLYSRVFGSSDRGCEFDAFAWILMLFGSLNPNGFDENFVIYANSSITKSYLTDRGV